MSSSFQLSCPTQESVPDEYRVVRHRHGIAIHGSLPVGEFNALCSYWGKQEGFTFLRTDLADILRATFVIVRNSKDADAWLKELDVRPDHPNWLRSGDCGISSKTIYATFTGQWHILPRGMADAAPPSDSDDFGRCYRLLNRYPAWRAEMDKLADKFPGYAALVPIWSDLEALFKAEKFLELNKRISNALYAKP